MADPDPFGLTPVVEPPLPTVGGTVDERALHGYLCLSHVPSPLAILAGHRRTDATPLRWPVPDGPIDAAAIRERLRASVRRRLPPDPAEPVGVFLSGGLDSALVAALLAESGARLHAWTLDFGPPHDVEVDCARAVAAHLRIPLQTVDARPSRILRAIDPAAAALPQPYGDGVVAPLWLLGAAARDTVRIVFNGEGGDQLFGGWANKPLVAAGAYGAADEVAEYLQTYHRFLGLTDRLYTAAQRERVGPVDPAAWVAPALDRDLHPDLLHRLRAANLALKGAQNIAPRCAALAACHGLTVAAPFFDPDLAAATFGLPPDAFLCGAVEKFVLKQAADPLLPAAIVWREKRGMGVPTADWCLDPDPLGRRIRAALSPRALRREERFDPAFVRALLRGQDPTPAAFRRRRLGEKLWTLFFWEAWRGAHGVG